MARQQSRSRIGAHIGNPAGSGERALDLRRAHDATIASCFRAFPLNPCSPGPGEKDQPDPCGLNDRQDKKYHLEEY